MVSSLSHVIRESEHLGLLDGHRSHWDLQQSDDEDDEHNELLHFEILIMTAIGDIYFGDRSLEIDSISNLIGTGL